MIRSIIIRSTPMLLTVLLCAAAAAPAAALTISAAELVSVGPDAAVVSFSTDATCVGSVRFGYAASHLSWTAEEREPLELHLLTLDGLEPATSYVYEIRCGGATATADRFSPGYFQTLVEPQGEFLFRFGTLNDMHIGEEVAGLLQLGPIALTPGFTWPDADNPYWLFSNAAALDGLAAAGVDLVVVKGDLTSESLAEQYDAYNDLTAAAPFPVFALRGNHDRPAGQDLFLSKLGLASANQSFEHNGFKFILLDSIEPVEGLPLLSNATMGFLRAELDAAPGTPTLLLLHYAVRAKAYGLGDDAALLLDMIDEYPQIRAVFSGHSHRAALDPYLAADGRVVPLIETPSSKEYPLGYTLYDVYEDGLVQLFQRSDCADCRAWQAITREEYFGMAPAIMLGPLSARCFSFVWDRAAADDDDDDGPPPADIPPGELDLGEDEPGCGG